MEEFNRVNDVHPETGGRWTFEANKLETFERLKEAEGTEVPFTMVKNNVFNVAGKKGGNARDAFSSSGIAAAAAMGGPGVSPEAYHRSMHGTKNGRVTWQERVD